MWFSEEDRPFEYALAVEVEKIQNLFNIRNLMELRVHREYTHGNWYTGQ